MSTPPALVADRYRLVRLLGAGGMGVVWEAWDERLHRTVALKMLRTQPELTDQERQTATDRALREARITAGLHHPHAVTVFDVVEHEGQPCIVMQLIESTPLSVLLREHGTFTPAETARIGAQVASALAAAHKLRIVHRDVKPGNILIGADGSAMISDFGISHALGDTTITATGLIHGTPAYLAPEAARGLPMSFASDVFSLGSTLYAMTEGEPPFGSENNAIALLHKVARGGYPAPKHAGPLTPLLRQMLATQPKRRPSMTAVVESLNGMQQGAVEIPAVVLASTAPLPEDWTTERIEDASLERIEDSAPEPLEDASAQPIEDASTDVPPEDATSPAAEEQTPADPRVGGPATPATIVFTPRTAPTAVAPEPTAETLRVDQPTRYEAPTAATEPLGRAAAVAPEVRAADLPPAAATPEPAPTTRRRRRRLGVGLGILILLIALGVGAWVLTDPLRQNGVGDAEPTRSAAATPSSATSATETPEPESPAPAPSASTVEATPTQPAAPPPQTPEERVVDSITGYYALMPAQRDTAWPLMTADYQENHAGGRGGYEAFWSGVTAVSVADVTASGPAQGQATVTYTFSDGRVVQEVTAYTLVDEGGVLKIAETDVLSSVEL
ncbi:protein kinase [Microbacterium sp. 4R-513]|uniref:serine/threonine-protein kinase n=1 Tax=Microbacterium sp. 4R-513 TaxID=2567934 RepID=UPI0013E203D2|nr:serine/threonine-protein kinase [Microbacterium sp. 4R-513]QIG39917.1 protein kinase [Microbacterium sp. 4R-513]